MTARFYRLLLATGAVFVLSLVLAVVDALGWLVLPHPARLAIPAALVLSTLVGIVMLSAAIGIPTRPSEASGETAEAPAETPEASGGGAAVGR